MKQKTKLVILVIILIIVGSMYYLSTKPGKYDNFAKCLTEKGTTFYGSFQCSHCAAQKKLFGKSIEYINYVECGPLGGPQTPLCSQKKINGYPTWEFADKSRVEGVKTLEALATKTGCTL